MKRTPEQAASVAAWLNVLDHAEAQLQSLGALKNPVKGRGPCMADRVRLLKSEVEELREQAARLRENTERVMAANAAARDRRILRARKSRETIEGLQREVTRFADMAQANADRAKQLEYKAKLSEDRRMELVVLAQELGCDCVPHKMLEAVKSLKDAARKVKR